MNGNKIILDSNIIIHILNKNLFANKLNSFDQIYIPVICVGEIYTGINRVSKSEKHIEKFNLLLKKCTVLEIDSKTAMLYGKIAADLSKKGTPIPQNDIWIAAIAIQHKIILVSSDKHFQQIQTLKSEIW